MVSNPLGMERVQAEGIYTQFLDHILVYDRWALFTATTLELGLE